MCQLFIHAAEFSAPIMIEHVGNKFKRILLQTTLCNAFLYMKYSYKLFLYKNTVFRVQARYSYSNFDTQAEIIKLFSRIFLLLPLFRSNCRIQQLFSRILQFTPQGIPVTVFLGLVAVSSSHFTTHIDNFAAQRTHCR